LQLTVRCEDGLAVTAIELRELEVLEPLVAFGVEINAAEVAGKAGRVGDPGPARALFRRFGVDPTKVRPSNEALLRRVKRGEGLPRINSLVDVGNVMSMLLQVPVGLYDLDRVEGAELVVRRGRQGEGYAGIGKQRVNVEGRICVADGAGPCGNPSGDSERTMITTETASAAWIYFLPVSEAVVERTAEMIAQYGRGLLRLPC
jgi:DNA/RNA-binding domain of Phe-tRNA-synthetase-like protein